MVFPGSITEDELKAKFQLKLDSATSSERTYSVSGHESVLIFLLIESYHRYPTIKNLFIKSLGIFENKKTYDELTQMPDGILECGINAEVYLEFDYTSRNTCRYRITGSEVDLVCILMDAFFKEPFIKQLAINSLKAFENPDIKYRLDRLIRKNG